MLYLDNAATSYRKPVCVYKTFIKNMIKNSGNAGHGGNRCSISAMNTVLETQDKIAKLFNIQKPANIAFCQNATYALNMAILGTAGEGGHIIITQTEHNSVLRPVHRLGNYSVISADKNGYTKAEEVEESIRSDTVLIICNHVSNVCGSIQNVEKIGQIAQKHNIPFLVDASQSAGCIEVDAERIKADMIAFSGHKGLMGPLGTGGLYVKNPDKLKPVIVGGTGSMSKSLTQPGIMPDMLHSGTLNAPAIAALGSGAEFVMRQGIGEIKRKEKELCDVLINGLLNMGGIKVYTTGNHTGVCAFNIEGISCQEVGERLDKDYNIMVRSGWHCAPLVHEAIGTKEIGAVRVSFGFFNKRADAERLLDAVFKISKNRG